MLQCLTWGRRPIFHAAEAPSLAEEAVATRLAALTHAAAHARLVRPARATEELLAESFPELAEPALAADLARLLALASCNKMRTGQTRNKQHQNAMCCSSVLVTLIGV